jgi:superfamily II DNA or RNA helicase
MIVQWALDRGRAAIFADTGLGKTAMQVEWARHVATHGRVLILAPLAVAEQTVDEARRFGVDTAYLRDDDGTTRIVVTNYDILDHFDSSQFAGIVLDESSILKSYTGATRNAIIAAFARTPYRLACTATPAPNDFTELGNHAEFLGVRSRTEMLAEFFVHDGGSTADWRLKGHAVRPFWRWVCSWAVVIRRPSDLGCEDRGYALPPLVMAERVIPVSHEAAHQVGLLFAPQATTLSDQRATRRMTMGDRAWAAADLCNGHTRPAIVWCELNAEADEIEDRIVGAVQIRGSDTVEDKRAALVGFANGSIRVLVTKPSIAGFGLNWQHCADVVFAGASHSFEQTYQAIRRCWRFGQTSEVRVTVIRATTEDAIVANYRRKEADAERLASEAVALASETLAGIARVSRWNAYIPATPMQIPGWMP